MEALSDLSVRLVIILGIVLFWACLYYFLCRDKDNWYNLEEDLTFFECVYFTLNSLTTIGNSNFNEKTTKCRLIAIGLYIVLIVGIIEIVIYAYGMPSK